MNATWWHLSPAPTEPGAAVRGWLVAAGVYVLAVFHRSSLGVAGLQAERRFHMSPGQLSTFVVLQVGVYAAMQIPTGVLVDRFGPRRLLMTAAGLMGVAQIAFAYVPGYPSALLARGLLGGGDALTFVSVLRFASLNFSPRRYPLVLALTGTLGLTGSVAATVPLTLALQNLGWSISFAAVGCASFVSGALVWWLLPGAPARPSGSPAHDPSTNRARTRDRLRRVASRVGSAWSTPGTRLGFWLHFSCMSSATAVGVLWGFPYLVTGRGYSTTIASSILLAGVLFSLTASPFVGWSTGRRPGARVPLAVTVCALTVAGWSVLLALPVPAAPAALVIGVIMFTAVGGPISAIGFALARDYNRHTVVGTASGVVNVGGFVAAMIASLGIGLVLDVAGSSAGSYRLAMVTLVVIQLLGTLNVLRWWRRARAEVLAGQERGEPGPVAVRRYGWDLAPH